MATAKPPAKPAVKPVTPSAAARAANSAPPPKAVVPRNTIPQTDPSAARYAALEKAAKSSPTAFKNIVAAQKSQAAAAAKVVPKKPVVTTPKAIIKKPAATTKAKTPVVKSTPIVIEQPEVYATPNYFVDSPILATVEDAVKPAPIDTVVFIDEAFSSELITDLLFEDIGGQELLTLARNDTVNGQAVTYQPIKNLNLLQEIYNPSNLLKLQETSDKYFANFIIDLRSKIPKIGNGENGLNYYLDLIAGNGVIEFVNLKSDEQVEIQIVSAGIIEDVGI